MMTIQHKFTDNLPDTLEEAVLYISMENAVAVHRCFCGCGVEVNTPLSPIGWTLRYDGDTVSLSPSIGSRSLPCQSHYWIERSRVRFLGWEFPDYESFTEKKSKKKSGWFSSFKKKKSRKKKIK